MKNFIQNGKTLTLAAPYDVVAGKGALVGAIFGVAVASLLSGVSGEFAVEGVYELTKVGSQAWSVGDRIFWDNSNKYCTKTSNGGVFIGYATEAAGSGAGVVLGRVKLTGPILAQVANVAALTGALTGTANGALVDVAATAGSCAGGSSPSAANVDSAIATAVASIVTGVNEQNKELLTKVNELIAALKTSGEEASS